MMHATCFHIVRVGFVAAAWLPLFALTPSLCGAEESENTDLARFLPNHGNSVYDLTGLLREWPADGPKKLWEVEIGWGKAAVVEAKLAHLDSWTEARQANAARYDGLLKESGLVEKGTGFGYALCFKRRFFFGMDLVPGYGPGIRRCFAPHMKGDHHRGNAPAAHFNLEVLAL